MNAKSKDRKEDNKRINTKSLDRKEESSKMRVIQKKKLKGKKVRKKMIIKNKQIK